MNEFDYQTIKRAYEKNGVPFDTAVFSLNIFGIRAGGGATNTFNDLIGCAYKSDIGINTVFVAAATTDPGASYLVSPMNTRGTAVLKPGYYAKSHKQGKHRGEYPALVQCGPLTVYRDNNRDRLIDIIPKSAETGTGQGINIHRASKNSIVEAVNNYSAGCQVFKRAADLDYLLLLCDKQEQFTKNRFYDYTLFDEADII